MERKLAEYGWHFLRHGANHDVWTNGDHIVVVPRHREVVERTAIEVLRNALRNKVESQK